MATHMIDRSTWWVKSGGSNPINTGDYRHFWSISYTTDKANRKTNFTVDYYVQYCFSAYEAGAQMDYLYEVPSGTSTVYINGSSIGSINTPKLEIEKASGWRTKYVGTKTFSIKHNNDGSASFKFYGTGFGKGTSTSEYSTANGDFTNIPSQSILDNIDTFNIDTGITSIGFKKYVDGYYHTLQIYKDNNIFKTIDGFNSGGSVTFTEAELDNIYTKIPTGKNTTFSFKLTTYTSSSKTSTVGTDTKTAIGNFTIVLPTVKGAVCTDNISNMPNWTGDNTKQTIIKNLSHIIVTIPSSMHAVANTRCSTIKEYVIEDRSVAYNASGNSVKLWDEDENKYVKQDTANVYNNKDHIVIYAVDSRGTSSLPFIQKFTRYVPYEPLSINTKTPSIQRDNSGVGRLVTIFFEGDWWEGNFGAIQNALKFRVYYRNAEDGYWTDINDFLSGADIGSIDTTLVDISKTGKFEYNGPLMSNESDKGFDVKYPYDVVVIVDDALFNYAISITVEYGEPAVAVYKNKAALGGPYDESLGGTQIWEETYLNGEPLKTYQPNIISVWYDTGIESSDRYIETFTAWVGKQIQLNTQNKIGDKLTLSNNAVIIGKGVSKIKMQGAIFYGEETPNGQLRAWCQVKDGTTDEIKASIPSYGYKDSTSDIMVTIPMMLVDVSEGDKVVLNGQIGPTSGDTAIRQKGTTLLVEVVE